MELIFFFIMAVLSVLSALTVVFAKSPVHSVLSLIVTFFLLSGQYVLLNAQFVAIVNLIVYAGAIMVLFLFVLMLLNLKDETEPQKSNLVRLSVTISAGMLLLTLIGSVRGAIAIPPSPAQSATVGLVENLGKILFSDFVVPFEVASILFIAAMVGAVLIGKRNKETDSEPLTTF
ncbi:MAG TPA: NADH-quinone oxidoreductase subunit J [Rhodothermales bacterium]|nr:NADH-quinone oxidoreductase subunit J [Bacteroidota bacterium]HRK73716.1 NADH-quinone oxidoreductase subunit J [Rhodothermales bacterium]HRR07216.1 NADH-quinone oxidoreductase subunit J [Rhodothermales bacterium]